MWTALNLWTVAIRSRFTCLNVGLTCMGAVVFSKARVITHGFHKNKVCKDYITDLVMFRDHPVISITSGLLQTVRLFL